MADTGAVARLRAKTEDAEREQVTSIILSKEDGRALLNLLETHEVTTDPTLWSDGQVAAFLESEGLEQLGFKEGYGVDVYRSMETRPSGSGRYIREAIADYLNKKE